HLPAEPAMVTLLRFFQLLEVDVELLLLGKGGAVDAAEHLAVGIAAPIGARDLHQLESVADLAGRGHVRAAAKVEPLALAIDFDLLVFRDGVDQLDLEQLALVAEYALGLLARPDLFAEGFVAGDDFAHLLLDGGEIFRSERLVAEEVVIKAVLDHRADGDLGAWPQRLHRLGEHMRGIVTDQLQRARVVAGEEFDFRVPLDGIAQVRKHAVEGHGNRALGERRRNLLGNVETSRPFWVFSTRAIGKGQRDHRFAPVAHSLPTTAGKRGRTVLDVASVRTAPLPPLPRGTARLYDLCRARNAACLPASDAPKVSDARRGNLRVAIGAAPGAVAPRQIPARASGQ